MTSQNHENRNQLPTDLDATADELDQISDAFPQIVDGTGPGQHKHPFTANDSHPGSVRAWDGDPGHEAAMEYALKIASGEEQLPLGTKLQTEKILAKLWQTFALEKLEDLARRDGPARDDFLCLFHAINAIERPDLFPSLFLELKEQIDRLEQLCDRPEEMHIELDRTYALAHQILSG